MLERIIDGLLEDRDQLSITLKSRTRNPGQTLDPNQGVIPTSTLRTKEISFPGNTVQEAWRFSETTLTHTLA